MKINYKQYYDLSGFSDGNKISIWNFKIEFQIWYIYIPFFHIFKFPA
jgi:hypothetical protein